MPTTRPRLTITETDAVAAALAVAARRWPEEKGVASRLIVRLALEGHQALEDEERLNRFREAARTEAP